MMLSLCTFLFITRLPFASTQLIRKRVFARSMPIRVISFMGWPPLQGVFVYLCIARFYRARPSHQHQAFAAPLWVIRAFGPNRVIGIVAPPHIPGSPKAGPTRCSITAWSSHLDETFSFLPCGTGCSPPGHHKSAQAARDCFQAMLGAVEKFVSFAGIFQATRASFAARATAALLAPRRSCSSLTHALTDAPRGSLPSLTERISARAP